MTPETTILELTKVTLITLAKPNGDFRPIGVGTGLSRIFQGAIAQRVVHQIIHRLHEDNITGTTRASELLGLTCHRAIQLAATMISMDLSNAFNNIDVAHAIEALEIRETHQRSSHQGFHVYQSW